jgi:hypothetical protein
MTIVLREMTRDAADAILAGERPAGMRFADDYPTEFSAGVARCVGAVGQFGPYVLQRPEDDLLVGEIGGAFVDDEGTITSATPWSSRSGTADTRPRPSRRS